MRPRFHRRGEGPRTRHELLFAQDDTFVYSIHFFEMAPLELMSFRMALAVRNLLLDWNQQ